MLGRLGDMGAFKTSVRGPSQAGANNAMASLGKPVLQPSGHRHISGDHCWLCRVGYAAASRSERRVCCLETLGWSELHLALYRQPGCMGSLHHLFVLQVFLLTHALALISIWKFKAYGILCSKYGSVRLGPEGS